MPRVCVGGGWVVVREDMCVCGCKECECELVWVDVGCVTGIYNVNVCV